MNGGGRFPGVREAASLTARELDVVRLLAQGCSYAQIGERLGISLHTVTSHIKNLYRKLGVRRAAAAVMRAAEHGVLDNSHAHGIVLRAPGQ